MIFRSINFRHSHSIAFKFSAFDFLQLVNVPVFFEVLTINLKFKPNFCLSDLDKEVRKTSSDANDFINAKLFVCCNNNCQNFLLASGLSSEERNFVGVKLKFLNQLLDVIKLIGTNFDYRLLVKYFSAI